MPAPCIALRRQGSPNQSNPITGGLVSSPHECPSCLRADGTKERNPINQNAAWFSVARMPNQMGKWLRPPCLHRLLVKRKVRDYPRHRAATIGRSASAMQEYPAFAFAWKSNFQVLPQSRQRAATPAPDQMPFRRSAFAAPPPMAIFLRANPGFTDTSAELPPRRSAAVQCRFG